jgi:hypothetical protein
MNYFNVFMSPYGDDGGSGGSGGDDTNVLNLTNFSSSEDINFVSSPYLFTDPPRYYKANDPYYFEVDNIPLKQIHENCLWLKDQIAGVDTEVSGLPVRKIIDLQPHVSETDRNLRVRAGKFTARINDAYSTNANQFWATFDNNQTVDLERSPIYVNPSVIINDSAFSTIVGQTVNQILYNNGLYDHYQHYPALIQIEPVISQSNVPNGPINFNFIASPSYLTTGGLSIAQIPKVRAAAWKQKTDTAVQEHPRKPDLQQLSVDFCRRWQGVFRTSVVNSPNTLNIPIPAFNEADYIDNNISEGLDAQVRIDLVFMYAHPVDSSESYIAKSAGEGPERITMPRLGLVKGAGAILAPNAIEGTPAVDIITTPSLIGGADWTSQATNNEKYYSLLQNGLEGASMSIQSTLSDQLAAHTPFNVTTGASFPSPDDLLNLAPLLSQDALDGGLQTVGQSVLPICYVIVKKGSPIILEEDIIDIRPFLRTTELTYNERAGVAAANPPLSLANPATGKYELYRALEGMREYLKTYIEQLTGNLEGEVLGLFMAPKPGLTSCIGNPIVFQLASVLGNENAPIPRHGTATSVNNDVSADTVAYSSYNTDTVILASESGAFRLIPGIYDIDWYVNVEDDGTLDSQPVFETYFKDGDNNTFIGTDTWIQRVARPGKGNESAGGSDTSQSSARMRGYVAVTQDMWTTGTQNILHCSLKKITGGNGNVAAGGVLNITRIQNLDGTEGVIK